MAVENKLWLLNLHVGRGSNRDMPAALVGAHVPVFVSAPDWQAAAKEAVAQVRKRGFEFIDISDEQVHQLDPFKWSLFIQKSFPEFVSQLPSQDEILAGLPHGKTFFGPFAGYERAQPGASPKGGPTEPFGNPGVGGGPPSVS